MTTPPAPHRPPNVPAAAAVHVYTAVGAVLAFWMVVAAFEGRTTTVLWLFLIAMVIDGSDGLLARRLRVKEAIPGFDGALLDNIVDYLTYCFAPMLLLWADGRLPGGAVGAVLASLPLALSIREQTDAGRPPVIAEPESAVAATYLEMAAAVEAALADGAGGAVRQFPEINIADD